MTRISVSNSRMAALRSVVRIAVVGVLLATMSFAIGTGSAAASAARAKESTPQRYVRGECSAVNSWIDATYLVDQQVVTVADALSNGKVTPKAAKAKVVALYTKAAKASAALVAETKALGNPKINGGAQLAKDQLAVVTDLQKAYQAAASSAAKLSTKSATKLYAGLEAIETKTYDEFDAIGMPLETMQQDATLAPVMDTDDECGAVVEAYKVSVEPTGFKVGDCVNFTNYTVVDCAAAHDGEVYLSAVYPGDATAAYPGAEEVNTYVDQLCTDAYAGYMGVALDNSKYGYTVIYPTADTWKAGDREVVCAVSKVDDSQLTGAVKGSGQ
jgi:hypothetical protein